MIPKRYEPILFALILSGLMSLFITGVATFRTVGLITGFTDPWLKSWLTAWPMAFPATFLVAPTTRRVVRLMTSER